MSFDKNIFSQGQTLFTQNEVATALREASNHMVNRIPVQNQ